MNKKLFVAYKALTQDGHEHTGSFVMEHPSPIESVEDIKLIEDAICIMNNYEEIVITNWKRMEDSE